MRGGLVPKTNMLSHLLVAADTSFRLQLSHVQQSVLPRATQIAANLYTHDIDVKAVSRVLGLCWVSQFISLILNLQVLHSSLSRFFDLLSTWLMLRVEEGKLKLSKIAFVCSVSKYFVPPDPPFRSKTLEEREGNCTGGLYRDSTSNNFTIYCYAKSVFSTDE